MAVCEASDSAMVPALVIGLPLTVMKEGAVSATLVTVPRPDPDRADCTNAVVANLVVLSPVVGVVAVADEPSATVPLKVFAPVIVCVLERSTNAPTPAMASTVVALPPAPPVPLP